MNQDEARLVTAVSFRRHGGLAPAAMRLATRVDIKALDPAEAKTFTALLAAATVEPPAAAPARRPRPDAFEYEISLERSEAQVTELVLSDGSMTDAQRRLVEWLVAGARR